MAQSNVPVMEAARAAYRFGREAWRPALGALALFGAVVALQYYLNVTGRPLWGMLATVLTLLVEIVAYGALFRLAFAAEQPDDAYFRSGPGGLQWGGMETRLLGATLLLVLLALIAVILFSFVFVIVFMVVAGSAGGLGAAETPQELMEALGPGGTLTISALVLLVALAAIYVAVRLVLVLPATAAERKVRVLETWPLTRGRFWAIFAAMIIASAPTIFFSVLNAGVMEAMGEEGARRGSVVLDPAEAAVMAVLAGVVTGVLQAPLTVGLGVYLYRRLGPVPERAAAIPSA